MRTKVIAWLIAVVLSGVLFFSTDYVSAEDSSISGSVVVTDLAPEVFEGEAEGKIDRITAGKIVIDDSLYTYSGKVKFLTFGGEEVSLRFFTKGDKVIYMLDESGEIVLLKKR